jgi:fanconi-associated nuclease 1
VLCRFVSHDGVSHVTVEDLALEHFALPENGSWAGVHCESGVWSTLFGILLWDVLFAPVPDVFRSRFQSAPLDLCTDAFAPARAEVLQSALQRIQSGAAIEMLESIWKQHEGALAR